MRFFSAHLLTIGKRMQIMAARYAVGAEDHRFGDEGAELQLVLDELRRETVAGVVVAISLMRSMTTSCRVALK